jgi:hypothetical protein
MPKILIIDEYGFARICSAILNSRGCETEMVVDQFVLPMNLNNDEYNLIITSYPYAKSLFSVLRNKKIPIIVLSDSLNEDLINELDEYHNSFCMIKPIDFEKFTSLVKRVVESAASLRGGYSIV